MVTSLVEENLLINVVYTKINLKIRLHTHVSCKVYSRLDQNQIWLQRTLCEDDVVSQLMYGTQKFITTLMTTVHF